MNAPETEPRELSLLADDVEDDLRVTVRRVLRGFGYGAACRGDVHVLVIRPDRLRTRIPCAVRMMFGHGRGVPVALPFRPRNRRGHGRKARL